MTRAAAAATSRLHCELDHLVVTAPSLQKGSDYIEQLFGIRPQPGGEHPRMGTHNTLLQLDNGAYLEVIACNPEAPHPGYPRWFNMDDAEQMRSPRLTTWVCRTSVINELLLQLPGFFDSAEPMTRGDMRWLFALRQDGTLPYSGMAPTLIEWHTAPHPASRLAPSGCQLQALRIYHPLAQQLAEQIAPLQLPASIQCLALPEGQPAYLEASLLTPRGLVCLR